MDIETLITQMLQQDTNAQGVMFAVFVAFVLALVYAGRQFAKAQALNAQAQAVFATSQQSQVSNQTALLESINDLAQQQSQRRDDTQTMLNTVQAHLTKTIEEKAITATELDALKGDITEYKETCQKHIALLTEQLQTANGRENDMNEQIRQLTEQNKRLIEQNRKLTDMLKSNEDKNTTRFERYENTIIALRAELEHLRNEYAHYELETAKTIARLEARFQLLDGETQEATHDRTGTDNTTGV